MHAPAGHVGVLRLRHTAVAEVVGPDSGGQSLLVDQRRKCLAESMACHVGYTESFGIEYEDLPVKLRNMLFSNVFRGS